MNTLDSCTLLASKVERWRTGASRAGWVAPVTVDALRERIDKKAQRLVEYQDAVQ